MVLTRRVILLGLCFNKMFQVVKLSGIRDTFDYFQYFPKIDNVINLEKNFKF